MWCRHCQQDVPGIADGDGATHCARCASVVRTRTAERKRHAPAPAHTANPRADWDTDCDTDWDTQPPIADDWQLEQQLSEAERLLHTFSNIGAPENRPQSMTPPVRLATTDLASTDLASRDWHQHAASEITRSTSEPKQRGNVFAWTFLLVGTFALVCGGVLAGWSLTSGRTALWNLGLPILLGGQGCLLVGIVLQVSRMWQNSRNSAQRLAQVDRQLVDLQQTTTLLGNTYGAGSSTFFAHLAEGASPHMLLADLKGQMDLLAMKVSRK